MTNTNDHKNSPKRDIRRNLFWLAGLSFLLLLIFLFSMMTKMTEKEEELMENQESVVEKEESQNETSEEPENSEEGDQSNEEISEESEEKMIVKTALFDGNGPGEITFEEYEVSKKPGILGATLEKLFELRGENNKWHGLRFSSVSIESGVATIKLLSSEGKQVTLPGEGSVQFIEEITSSVTQFETVDSVNVLVNGSSLLWTELMGQNNNGGNQNAVAQNPTWTACTGLFPYTGNQANSTFMDTEMGAILYTTGNPAEVSNGYEVRGCIQQIAGTYDSWGPFEGMVGAYKIKDQNGNILISSYLAGKIMPGSTATELMGAAIAGENLYFKETVSFDFSPYAGQNGTIEIHNNNVTGETQNDRMKTYAVVFQ